MSGFVYIYNVLSHNHYIHNFQLHLLKQKDCNSSQFCMTVQLKIQISNVKLLKLQISWLGFLSINSFMTEVPIIQNPVH